MMTAPEVGQTVLVRGRPYIVEECTEQALPETTQQNQHLVTLSCLDENSLDETLQVIWELEPGAEIREASSLPDVRAFDDPGDLDAFLHAVRWGIISQMDHSNMQSPFRSGIEPEDYQLEPVARALTMPRVNLLLADDVGLGKTIEAGLTMQELMLRNRATTVLIVCPASLQYQWRDEMRDKFGLEFRIINSESVSHLRRQRGIHVNPWTHFPRLITSIDYFKQDRVFQRFCETLPAEGAGSWPRRYDLLIVDEAHNIAPAGSLHYAKPSLRTRIIRRIVPHFEHRLFLTATPHNGYSESFSALLEILDPQRFIRGVTPTADMLRQVMVRRMKSDIVAFDGTPRFPRREIHPLEVAYSEEERTVHRLFQRYAALCTARLRDAGGVPWLAMRFVLILLKKRLFSSPRAFASTLEKHAASRSRARTAPRRHRQAQWQLPDFEEMTDNEAAEALDEVLDNAAATLPCPDAEEEQALTELRGWAQRSMQRRDSKAEHLLDWLQQTLCPGGVWNRTRVVIFTEYMDTQHYLAELLNKSGMGGERLICLNGATSAQERERFKAAFQADPDTSPVRILLGTDAASEGINLQNHCSRLIHYEIPWNPSRLEQRNGRVDRHGQHAPVVDIYHFVAADLAQGQHDVMAADLEFLYRVVNKVETIRQDLGKVGPVIAEQVEQAMLAGGNRRRELVTSRAERDAEAARSLLKLDRDLKRILQDIHSRMDATRNELLLTPEHVRHTVEVALRLANQPPLTPVDVPGLPAGRAFRLPAFNGAWAACLEGNAHPYTLQPRPVVFSGDDAAGRDDVVLAHLNHRLVSMSLRLLRAQLWASDLDRRLHRNACRLVPSSLISEPVVVVLGRIIVVGSTSQRIYEEMIMAGGRIRAGRFARMGMQELESFWNSAMSLAPVRAEGLEADLGELWTRIGPAVRQALEVRCDERLKTLQSRMERRAQDEVARFSAVMDELAVMIRKHLEEMRTPQQLSLFDAEEREAFQADVNVLQARLRRIPAEKEEECRHLRARYAQPRQTLFPLAILWFIPQSLARGGSR